MVVNNNTRLLHHPTSVIADHVLPGLGDKEMPEALISNRIRFY